MLLSEGLGSAKGGGDRGGGTVLGYALADAPLVVGDRKRS
jgi:hypothetical protein